MWERKKKIDYDNDPDWTVVTIRFHSESTIGEFKEHLSAIDLRQYADPSWREGRLPPTRQLWTSYVRRDSELLSLINVLYYVINANVRGMIYTDRDK